MADLSTGDAAATDATGADPGPQEGTRIAVRFAVANHVLFALMALAWWAAWGGLDVAAAGTRGGGEVVRAARAVLGVNLLFGLLVVAGCFALHPVGRPWRQRILIIVAVALLASAPRAALLLAIPSTPTSRLYLAVELVAGVAAALVAVGSALLVASLVRTARGEERRRVAQEQRARQAVEELQAEEMRVRRMVSDQLHGRLQFRIVAVTAGLDRLAEQLAGSGRPEPAAELRAAAETLEEIREDEVRSLSHAVFPSGAALSTVTAIDVLLRRLPPEIETSIELGPRYRALVDRDNSPMPVPERLVAIYTVEEAVTNALKHGHASAVHVRAEAGPTDDPARWVFEVTVDDDGRGPAQEQPELHGLARHRARIEQRGGVLELGPGPRGGARLSFTLPFEPTGAGGPAAG